MSDIVWLLWLEPQREGDDVELLMVYRSEEAAKGAIERLKNRPGFKDRLEGFQVHPRRLDEDSWTEGFVVVYPSPN